MGREIVGLKIGASRLAAARVETNGSARLLQVASAPLSGGIVAGGEIRDPEALAAALKDFFAKNNLPRRAVRVGVANNRVGVRTIELSGVQDEKQLANAVRFRAQEALPIPLTEAVLDYQILSEHVDPEAGTTRRILVVVSYRDLVESYAVACKKAGLKLVGIDLEPFALLRALTPFAEVAEQEPADRGALVAVSVGSERSTLAVGDGAACEFTRVLDWGGSALTGTIARELNLEPHEAERVKRSLSLDGSTTPEGLSEFDAAKAREAALLGLQSFARELVSSLQFYQNQPGSLGIREIVIAGGTAKLGGLAEALQRMVGVFIRTGDPLVNLAHGKKIKGGDVDPSLAIAIGLGMGV
jgi:type IV pilus assembly protein PilM